jgi:hypothetical protein
MSARVGYFLFHSVKTGSGSHPTSYRVGTRGSFPGGKAAGPWIWPLTFIQCQGQEFWRYTSTPPCVLMAWYLIIKYRNNFIFTFYLTYYLHFSCGLFFVSVKFYKPCTTSFVPWHNRHLPFSPPTYFTYSQYPLGFDSQVISDSLNVQWICSEVVRFSQSN